MTASFGGGGNQEMLHFCAVQTCFAVQCDTGKSKGDDTHHNR